MLSQTVFLQQMATHHQRLGTFKSAVHAMAKHDKSNF
jgi:hypothetical protein